MALTPCPTTTRCTRIRNREILSSIEWMEGARRVSHSGHSPKAFLCAWMKEMGQWYVR